MAFYGIKKILLLISLSLFFFSNCQACEHGESNEENCCSRILRKFSGLFPCLFGDCLGTLTKHHYKKIGYDEDYEIEGLVDTENQPIDMLPNELLYQIAVFLSPPDVISLIKSNKKFSCLKNNNFWLYYNKKYDYFSWNEELPAITVAFSYYWFRNNKVRKAAAMGFPRARTFLKQQAKLKRESPKSYEISSYDEISNYVRSGQFNELMHRKLSYGKHW